MVEIVKEDRTVAYRKCECQDLNRMKKIMESSGINEKWINFENYNATNSQQKYAKGEAIQYVLAFDAIKTLRKNSIAFLGQVGTGKTHLSIAIGLALLKKGIPVLYMPYIDTITRLKQLKINEEEYQREIGRYKEVEMLLIDDLFKGKITEADINIAFEIINHRYLKHLPVIISTELNIEYLLNIDEAIGSRIVEMSKDFLIDMKGQENYRLKGFI